jgi:glycosyltransferase domain-containing protein
MLRSYQLQNLKGRIVVADASEGDEISAVKDAVELASRDLDIDYRLYPADVPFSVRVQDALSLVRSEFAALGADDDVFTIAGLQAAVKFLKANSDYSVAHGLALIFDVEPGPVYGSLMRTAHYAQRGVELPTGASRLVDHLSSYSTMWYSMHRTERLQANFRATSQFGPDYFIELLPSCLSVIHGKAKKLDHLYMLRQVYPSKTIDERRERLDQGKSLLDWITDPEWSSRYRHFEDCLSAELVARDGIQKDLAIDSVKNGFWAYLSKGLSRKWQQRYSPGPVSSIKGRLARLVPGLPQVWQRGRSLMRGEENQLLLPALLRPSSPYHTDFMPIYEAFRSSGSG